MISLMSFAEEVASTCELNARYTVGRKAFRQNPSRRNRVVGSVSIRRHYLLCACEDNRAV